LDNGPGSLRQAVLDANDNAGSTNSIQFQLPGEPQTISLLTPLPALSDPLTVSLDASQNVTIQSSAGGAWDNPEFVTQTGAGTLVFASGIEGPGEVTVDAGSTLAADHIIQDSLVIGGNAANPAALVMSGSVVDVTHPTAVITAVAPSPRNSAVSQMQLVFSEAVNGVNLTSLSLCKDGGANLLGPVQTLTTSDNITYTLGNLSSLTGGSGTYTLTLTAARSRIADSIGNALAGNAISSFVVDATAPTAVITAVTPSPRNTAVSQMQFVFSEAVSGVLIGALSLSVNGGANLLTAAQTLTTTDNITYTLGNLSSLTAGSGTYTLTLTAAGSGITDVVGNALTGDATSSFVVNATAPTVAITPVTPSPRSTAVSQMQFVFSEAVSGVTLGALSLSMNGGANLLTAAQTLTTSDNITYTLGNLSSLTAGSGTYTLTVTAAGSGITDSVGNPLAGDATSSFVVNLNQWSGGPTSFLPGLNDYSADPNATAVSEQIVSTDSGSVLVILGTTGTDTIILSESGNSVTVATSTGNQAFTGPFVGIALYGFGGGDTIRFDHTIDAGTTSVVYGGGGGNTLSDAGPDTAYLYAGSGNDTLITIGGGADYLSGGAGVDSFWFDSSDNLSGSTAAETAAKSIHKVTAFVQPTANPAQAVSLEIAGQDIVDPVSAYGYTNNFVNQPLWNGGPQFNDPRQGTLDDCYFLAGLSALADTDPGLLQQSIVALGDGTYAVRFFRGGSDTYYRVDAQLPTNGSSPAYDQLTPTGALWVALEEKAFAQFRSGQNSYSSLNGGWMDEAYTAITSASYSAPVTSTANADAFAQNLANALAAGHAVTAASNSPSQFPIISNHAYSVHAVNYVGGTWYITVYNPWGFDGASYDSNPSDGLLTLTASQFKTCFYNAEICNA
jgi:hypothetical protein